MTIAETREKCKTLIANIPRDVLIIGILVVASSTSFWLGYLARIDVEQGSSATTGQASTLEVEAPTESVGVVASKNGTKYYLSGCAGVDRISDVNKVWFASAAAAIAAGYALAANCK